MLESNLQILAGSLGEGFADPSQRAGREATHKAAQGRGEVLRKQGRPQQGIGHRRLQQGEPDAGGQGGVRPVLEQAHLGPQHRIGWQQWRLRLELFEVEGDRRRIRNHGGSVHQHRHLALTGQAEQAELPQTGSYFNSGVGQTLDRQDQAHLFAEGRVSELVQLQHRQIGPLGGRVAPTP